MAEERLTNAQKAYLTATYQKAWDNVLMHDVKYLMDLDPSFFDKLVDSSDETLRNMGQYAKLIQWYMIDWWNGDYKTSWEVIAAFTAALLYMVNPWDLKPDNLSDDGWVDDLFVLQLALDHYDAELDRYVEIMNIDTSDFDAIWEQ